jgi:hypothetical protein
LPADTTRLGIPYPLGADLVSAYPAVALSAADILDNSTIFYPPNTLAERPAASSVAKGTLFYATDAEVLYVTNDAANWTAIQMQTDYALSAYYGGTAGVGLSGGLVSINAVGFVSGTASSGDLNTAENAWICPVAAGAFHVDGSIGLNLVSGSYSRLSALIYKNGTEVKRGGDQLPAEAFPVFGVSGLIDCVEGDVIQLYVGNGGGTGWVFAGYGQQTYLDIHRVA